MVFPISLTVIQDEAFMGTAASVISIPPSVTTIGDRAFFGSETLREVYIPETVTSIGKDAFLVWSESFVIYGESGSYAEEWALDNGYLFASVS